MGRAFRLHREAAPGGHPARADRLRAQGVAERPQPVFRGPRLCATARRFDMGERDTDSMELASVGMELMASWGQRASRSGCALLTGLLAERLGALGATLPDARLRAPHVLCVGFRTACRRGDRGAGRAAGLCGAAAGAVASARMCTMTRRMWSGSSPLPGGGDGRRRRVRGLEGRRPSARPAAGRRESGGGPFQGPSRTPHGTGWVIPAAEFYRPLVSFFHTSGAGRKPRFAGSPDVRAGPPSRPRHRVRDSCRWYQTSSTSRIRPVRGVCST